VGKPRASARAASPIRWVLAPEGLEARSIWNEGRRPRVNYLVLSSTIGGGMIVSVPKGDSRTIENGP
jgi:hypothetical protein